MQRTLDPDGPIPLYFQLKNLLREQILSGRFGPGERLPTEMELCEIYGISRTPVHRALAELAEEGAILRHRRRGSFVNPHWVRNQSPGPELRILVPEGFWEHHVRQAAGSETRLNLAVASLPELHRTITHAIGEGRGPDLAVLDSVWVADFVEAGFLHPLDQLDPSWVYEELAPDMVGPFVDAYRFEGSVYAVQAEIDLAGLWYRRDLLPGDPPSNWSELRQSAESLSKVTPYPFVFPGGARGGETTTYCLLGLLASNGASVITDGAVTLKADATLELLEFLRDLIDDDLIPKKVVAFDWDRPIRHLVSGESGLALGGSYELGRLARLTRRSPDAVTDLFGFAPIPGGPRGHPVTLAGGMVYGILRQARHPELAMRVLKRLVDPVVLAGMAPGTGQIPTRASALEKVAHSSSFMAITASFLRTAVTRPLIPAYPRVSAQLQLMAERVLSAAQSPADAAAFTASMISAITGLPIR